MKEIRILGILITDRIKEAGQTQKVLSEFAHIIKSRLGFHEVTEAVCSRLGIIMLQLVGSIDEQDKLESALNQIGGIQVRRMQFEV
ncbi:MAG TPA: hypothetical protein PK028_03305 [Bacteroidales bacterium]|jgi:hypothetical protein|nr:hypothetical protein [Bacteroidales bacterium]MDI9574563.1 hypothetical protein [Bacteroidota bacterium]OQC61504.1 MAG: hypothetical protein BWX51_00427 [Bacteroidetes bacterium ADurb.Bin012]MBP9512014.1 hypothetical protein [Bacteroidales bacterium]MBP9588633.1 hypothetical protein [Bacteroidales bacterium]